MTSLQALTLYDDGNVLRQIDALDLSFTTTAFHTAAKGENCKHSKQAHQVYEEQWTLRHFKQCQWILTLYKVTVVAGPRVPCPQPSCSPEH